MSTLEFLDDDREPVIDLSFSPAEGLTILDIPPRRSIVASDITEVLKQRGYWVHLLTGEDKPEGVALPFGVWPHPTADVLTVISEAAEMPIRTPEERAALEDQVSLSSAA